MIYWYSHYAYCNYAKCRCAECHYAECRGVESTSWTRNIKVSSPPPTSPPQWSVLEKSCKSQNEGWVEKYIYLNLLQICTSKFCTFILKIDHCVPPPFLRLKNSEANSALYQIISSRSSASFGYSMAAQL